MKGKIILLEDDPACMVFYRAALVRRGYETLCASTCCEVQRHLADNPNVDALVLDVFLNTQWCHGTDIALRSQKTQPGMKILFVSGTGFGDWSETDRKNVAALREGSFDVLGKPFTAEMLWSKVCSLMERPLAPWSVYPGCPQNAHCTDLNPAGTGSPLR